MHSECTFFLSLLKVAFTQGPPLMLLLSIIGLFIPSNSELVASPSPSNIGANRSKVGEGQEKTIKMLPFRQLT